jgi:hypothetical protein
MRLDLGTVSGIIEAKRKIREKLGEGTYKNFYDIAAKLASMSSSELVSLCSHLHNLRDHCRVLMACEVEVIEGGMEHVVHYWKKEPGSQVLRMSFATKADAEARRRSPYANLRGTRLRGSLCRRVP